MAKPIITIIGLGLTGASMGLALQREAGNFEIVGHDKRPEVAQEMRKLGAVQRTEWNLYRACEGAELIVVAVPLNELAALLPLLAEELKPGTLILAIGSLLQPAIEIAGKTLPAGVHFVAGHPVITGVGAAPSPRADLFERAVFALSAGLNTDPAAVQLASDFVERVGATPLFVDAQEHDGIMAGVEHLPMLLAAALMRVSAGKAGWREARRLAGQHFASATELGSDAAGLFAALQANRENVILKLRQLRQELAEWQTLLETELETPVGEVESSEKAGKAKAKDAKGRNAKEEAEVHPLLAALEYVVTERGTWEAQTVVKNWEETPGNSAAAAESSGFLKQMFLGGLGNRQQKRK
jgi:prephenate dehydrogenase